MCQAVRASLRAYQDERQHLQYRGHPQGNLHCPVAVHTYTKNIKEYSYNVPHPACVWAINKFEVDTLWKRASGGRPSRPVRRLSRPL